MSRLKSNQIDAILFPDKHFFKMKQNGVESEVSIHVFMVKYK